SMGTWRRSCCQLRKAAELHGRRQISATCPVESQPGPGLWHYARTTTRPRKQGGVSNPSSHPPWRVGEWRVESRYLTVCNRGTVLGGRRLSHRADFMGRCTNIYTI